MSEDFSSKFGSSLTAELEAQVREYEAQRQHEYNSALARLEDESIEPEQHAAYEATRGEMLALGLNDLIWPSDDPRFSLHRAMEYGKRLELRRADIEKRWRNSLPLGEMFSIHRYALAALHAFKTWRAHPEPDPSFEKLVTDAAHLRYRLVLTTAVFTLDGLFAPNEFQNFDGGVTPECIACDLFLLTGILQDLPSHWKNRMPATQVHLIEGALLAKTLLKHVAGATGHAESWEPRLLYARAYTLVDRASFHAELVLSAFHNEERDPTQFIEWKPECLFCKCELERQRHHRHKELAKDAQRRAQFVSSTMTAALRYVAVEN